MDPARASAYRPLAEPDLGLALARVRTAQDAVDFANRFGLLRAGSVACGKARGTPHPYEEVAAFTTTAEDLRWHVDTQLLVRLGVDGNKTAIERLRRMVFIPEDADVLVLDPNTDRYVKKRAGDVYSPSERFVDADDHTILVHASQRVAQGFNDGFESAEASVFERAFVGEAVRPGLWRIGMSPVSLAGACY